MNDAAVRKHAEEAWEMMLNNASSAGRTEYGFYIYYRHLTDEIYCGEIKAGANVTGCAGTAANVNPGAAANNRDVCAFYHCHTTLFYCPEDCSRPTGPSLSDSLWANAYQLPGIVDDYTVSILKGGMKKKLPHKMTSFGPNQRPNQQFPPEL